MLRFWGIGFGLPNLHARPDEIEIVARAMRFFSGDLNPHFFHYPSLYFYLTAGVSALFFVLRGIGGGTLETFLAEAAVDPSPHFLLARGVSATFGVLTIVLLFLGTRKFLNRDAGLFAAFFLAISPLHVRDSHFATTDVALAFFSLLAGFAVLRLLTRRSWKDYAWAGVAAGLVTATKYIGIIFIFPLLLAHLLAPEGEDAPTEPPRASGHWIFRKLGHPGPWVFLLCAALTFLITSPFAVLDFPVSWTHFRFQMAHLGRGHAVLLGPGWLYHPRFTLPLGLGWPVYLASIGGFALLLRRHLRQSLVFFGFPGLFFLSTASSQTVFLRYMLPLLPFAAMAAGYGVWSLLRSIPMLRGPRWAILLALALGSPGLYRTIMLDGLLFRTDSRVLAAEWLEDHSQGTARVHLSGSEYGHAKLPPPPDSLRILLEQIRGPALPRDFGAAGSFVEKRLEAQLAERLAAGPAEGFLYVPASEMERADWVVVQRSPLAAYSRPSGELEEFLANGFEEVHRIPGVPVSFELGWYDQQDAFYLPMADFRGIVRPGPTISIYRPRMGNSAPSPDGGRKGVR